MKRANQEKNLDNLNNLLKSGADPNATFDFLDPKDLIYSCASGHFEIVKLFVENSSDSNTMNNYAGWSALIEASLNGHFDIVKLLIEHGVDPNKKTITTSRNSAHMTASLNGHFDIVKFLIKNGADLNAKDFNSNSALMKASLKGHFEIVKFLIENGADLNVKSKYYSRHPQQRRGQYHNHTALMYASNNGNFEIAVYLLEHGAETRRFFFNKEVKAALNERIEEINEIRVVIKAILFPCDEPVIAQIVAEFTDGLENLTKNKKDKNNYK